MKCGSCGVEQRFAVEAWSHDYKTKLCVDCFKLDVREHGLPPECEARPVRKVSNGDLRQQARDLIEMIADLERTVPGLREATARVERLGRKP